MTAYGRAVNKLTMRLLVNEMPMCFDGGSGAACICVSLCLVLSNPAPRSALTEHFEIGIQQQQPARFSMGLGSLYFLCFSYLGFVLFAKEQQRFVLI